MVYCSIELDLLKSWRNGLSKCTAVQLWWTLTRPKPEIHETAQALYQAQSIKSPKAFSSCWGNHVWFWIKAGAEYPQNKQRVCVDLSSYPFRFKRNICVDECGDLLHSYIALCTCLVLPLSLLNPLWRGSKWTYSKPSLATDHTVAVVAGYRIQILHNSEKLLKSIVRLSNLLMVTPLIPSWVCAKIR